jgi:lysophospholipase L1-like esterase
MEGPNSGGRLHKGMAFAAVAVSLALSLGLAEIAIRLLSPYNTPGTIRQYSLQYEPAVYARHLMKPMGRLVEVDAGKGWGTKDPDKPSYRSYFINVWGYRGPEFSASKEPSTTRLLFLGGSAVFDQNVSDTNSFETNDWPHKVGRRLRARGLRVEVINAGVPGHASADSLGRLLAQLWLFEPDYVLVYQAWNDIKLWHRKAITPETPLIRRVRPYDERRNPFIAYQGPVDEFLSHSQLYVKLRRRVLAHGLRLGGEGAIEVGATGSGWSRFGPEQFRLDLELIVDACRNLGAVPILSTQGTLVTPDVSPEARERIRYDYQLLTHEALAAAVEEANRIVRDVASEKGAPLMDVASQIGGREDLFADHVHMNAAGSDELARVTSEFLVERLR